MTTTAEKETSPPAGARRAGGRLRRWLRVARWALYVFLLAACVLIFTTAGDGVGDWLVHVDPLDSAEYIVVLGGGADRAVEAAHLYREGWAPKVIVSSGGGGADHLARVARAYGVPAGAILLDRGASRTADHPESVAALAGVDRKSHRFIVITSPMHTSRARACFLRAGYARLCMRCPGWRRGGPLADPHNSWARRAHDLVGIPYECLAWTYYKLRGWL